MMLNRARAVRRTISAGAVLLVLGPARPASSGQSRLAYEQFIAQVRACNEQAELRSQPESPAQWRERAADWGRCMKVVSDKMPAEQRRQLEQGMRSCNAKFPYATKPGDNIHCLREVIGVAFPDAADPGSRYRMLGAEIAGRCLQLHRADAAAELACIRAGLKELTGSGSSDGARANSSKPGVESGPPSHR